MQPRYNRKTSPKVVGGQVLRKNNHVKTAKLGFVVDRIRPAKGFRHLLRKKDIHDFVDLIADWHKVSQGIESIILDCGNHEFDGCYRHYPNEDTGSISLAAWPEELWIEYIDEHYQEHLWLLKELQVVADKVIKKVEVKSDSASTNIEYKEEISWLCYFNEAQAKAFTLMHVFLHELGHHVDNFRGKKRGIAGGEEFAENYAVRRFYEIWPSYLQKFGDLY